MPVRLSCWLASNDPPATLEALGACSHENVFPRRLFTDLDEAARARQAARRLGNEGRAVASMLRATSLGQQPDLAPWLRAEPLAGTRLPVTWLSGSRDHKFHQLACQLVKQGCNINHLTLDGGHNLHTSQPERFASCLRDWIASTP